MDLIIQNTNFAAKWIVFLSWLNFLNIFLLYLFAYGLVYDAVSMSNLVVECLVSNKLEKMQKETVIT